MYPSHQQKYKNFSAKISSVHLGRKKQTSDTMLPVTLLFSLLFSVPGQHTEVFQQSFYHSSQQATSNKTCIRK